MVEGCEGEACVDRGAGDNLLVEAARDHGGVEKGVLGILRLECCGGGGDCLGKGREVILGTVGEEEFCGGDGGVAGTEVDEALEGANAGFLSSESASNRPSRKSSSYERWWLEEMGV
jgi:hypothetical protein